MQNTVLIPPPRTSVLECKNLVAIEPSLQTPYPCLELHLNQAIPCKRFVASNPQQNYLHRVKWDLQIEPAESPTQQTALKPATEYSVSSFVYSASEPAVRQTAKVDISELIEISSSPYLPDDSHELGNVSIEGSKAQNTFFSILSRLEDLGLQRPTVICDLDYATYRINDVQVSIQTAHMLLSRLQGTEILPRCFTHFYWPEGMEQLLKSLLEDQKLEFIDPCCDPSVIPNTANGFAQLHTPCNVQSSSSVDLVSADLLEDITELLCTWCVAFALLLYIGVYYCLTSFISSVFRFSFRNLVDLLCVFTHPASDEHRSSCCTGTNHTRTALPIANVRTLSQEPIAKVKTLSQESAMLCSTATTKFSDICRTRLPLINPNGTQTSCIVAVDTCSSVTSADAKFLHDVREIPPNDRQPVRGLAGVHTFDKVGLLIMKHNVVGAKITMAYLSEAPQRPSKCDVVLSRRASTKWGLDLTKLANSPADVFTPEPVCTSLQRPALKNCNVTVTAANGDCHRARWGGGSCTSART